MINLFISHFKTKDVKRQKELDYCLKVNSENPLIDKIINFENRPSYNDFFFETEKYPNDINILANADIYFNETLEYVNDIRKGECYAITRWELDGKKIVPFEVMHIANKNAKAKHSQDVWVFRGTIGNVHAPFYLGQPGCDNKIASILMRARYRVTNPCLTIQCIHKHKNERRVYSLPPVNNSGNPWRDLKWVEACSLPNRPVLGREIKEVPKIYSNIRKPI